MNERNRMLLLIIIMATACLIVAGSSITVLYTTAFEEQQARLMETAQSQARLIEAIARFDAAYSVNYPGGSKSATLSQIIDAHENYTGFGTTGEFTLSRKEGDKIVFLLSHRHYDLNKPKPVPFRSELAEPMRRALSGRSGTVVGIDYRGETVLAAHEPVAGLNLGIVAKIDLSEIRAPFMRAGLITSAFAILVIIAGVGLFLQISNPIIRQLSAEKELNESMLNAAVDTIFVFDPKTRKPIRWNKAFSEISGFTDEEIASKKAPDEWYKAEDLKQSEKATKTIVQERTATIEMSLITKDGRLIPTEYAAAEVKNTDYIIAIGRDLTERKVAEKKLQESEKRYRILYNNTPIMLHSIDPDGRLVSVSDYWRSTLGYDRSEVIGQKLIEFFEEDSRRFAEKVVLPEFYKTGFAKDVPYKIIKKNGELIDVLLSAIAEKDDQGNMIRSLAVMVDVTEKNLAEEHMKASLKEKEVLLKEIHHRVKNNMQVITSLLRLQATYIKDKQYADMFQESQQRIKSMAQVHEKLYQAKDFTNIDLKGYINTLVTDLLRSHGFSASKIALKNKVDDISLGIDNGIPCGLIINEIVSNSLKHAFPHNRTGEIMIALRSINADEVELVVGDNGIGIPEDRNISNAATMGLRLIRVLVEHQLGGSIKVDREAGTTYYIKFKKPKYKTKGIA